MRRKITFTSSDLEYIKDNYQRLTTTEMKKIFIILSFLFNYCYGQDVIPDTVIYNTVSVDSYSAPDTLFFNDLPKGVIIELLSAANAVIDPMQYGSTYADAKKFYDDLICKLIDEYKKLKSPQ